MAAAIKLVGEQEVSQGADGALEVAPSPALQPRPAAPARNPEIVGAIQTLHGRLQAVETAIQGVPKAIGMIGTLARGLGARMLMGLALLGCLALAGAVALRPSWEGLAIFGAFAVLVYLPLAALAYLNSRGD